MRYLMTFSTHFDAIYANRTLLSAGLDVRLMPVPRVVSASCGACVCISAGGEGLPEGLDLGGLRWENIYTLMDAGWIKTA